MQPVTLTISPDLNFQWNLAGLRRQWDGFRRAVGLPNEKLEEALPHPSPTELVVIRNTLADAPNISLNSHDQFWRSELRAAAIFGTLLQLGVVIYSGFATYYPTLRFKKENHTISGYAFPCTAVGTLVLVAGMLLCGHVVETSTNEERFQANGGRIARLVWLQKPKTVSDQVFDSFAVYPKVVRHVITTSSRAMRATRTTAIH